MPDALSVAPHVNGVLETSLYVESAARSAEFYRRVFGFNVIAPAAGEGLDHNTRLCAMRAGDRTVLLLFKRGGMPDTDAQGAIHIAFSISRSDLRVWEDWLSRLGIAIESRKRWKHGAEALYFRDPDGHLLEVVTPGGPEYLYEALDYVGQGKVKSIIETYPLAEALKAYQRVAEGKARFCAVLTM